MYVLVILALINGPSGGPEPITRPVIEYYKSQEDCMKYGVKHLKDFFAGLEQEPILVGAKCVRVAEVEGDPA